MTAFSSSPSLWGIRDPMPTLIQFMPGLGISPLQRKKKSRNKGRQHSQLGHFPSKMILCRIGISPFHYYWLPLLGTYGSSCRPEYSWEELYTTKWRIQISRKLCLHEITLFYRIRWHKKKEGAKPSSGTPFQHWIYFYEINLVIGTNIQLFIQKMGHSRHFFFIFVYSTVNSCSWLDSNHGPLESELTALPTEKHPLPRYIQLFLKMGQP